MLMTSVVRAKAQNTQEMRKFGLVMLAAIPAFFGLVLPIIFGAKFSWIPWIIGAAFGLLAFAGPKILGWIYIPWMLLAGVLGAINQRILMFLFFWLIVTPVGLTMKLIGRDPLHRRVKTSDATYRIIREGTYDTRHMERPF